MTFLLLRDGQVVNTNTAYTIHKTLRVHDITTPLCGELVAEALHLGFRIEYKVPLAVGEFDDLGDLQRLEAFAKRKEINNFNVERLYLRLVDECREISVRSGNSKKIKSDTWTQVFPTPSTTSYIVYCREDQRFSRMRYHRGSAYFQMLAIQLFFQLFQKGKVLRLRPISHIQARRGRDHNKIVRRKGLQNSEVECGERSQVSIDDLKLWSDGMGDYGHVGQSWVILVSERVNPCFLYL